MAGDWMPMRLDLHEDPAVLQMASMMDVREEVIVGYLHKVWSWASRQLRDGCATHVTLSALGRATNLPGFPEIMKEVGWLKEKKDGIVFPKWDRWMSESAKKRLENSGRQRSRRRANVAQNARQNDYKSATTVQYSTVQNRSNNKLPPKDLTSYREGDSTGGGVVSWKFLSEELAKCGVTSPGRALAQARAAGCSAEGVMGLVTHWLQNGDLGPGALYRRIEYARPDLAARDGWPQNREPEPPRKRKPYRPPWGVIETQIRKEANRDDLEDDETERRVAAARQKYELKYGLIEAEE